MIRLDVSSINRAIEGFHNAPQPQKPHWESARPFFAFPYDNKEVTLKPGSHLRHNDITESHANQKLLHVECLCL